jgi:hypothetical protein
MQAVKDLSVEELRAVIGEMVEEKLREILSDPEAGLVIRPEVRERLAKDLQEPQQEDENIPAAELARRRGWNGRCIKSNFAPGVTQGSNCNLAALRFPSVPSAAAIPLRLRFRVGGKGKRSCLRMQARKGRAGEADSSFGPCAAANEAARRH